MIDLTGAPEDATHYALSANHGVCWYRLLEGGYLYLYDYNKGSDREWSGPSKGVPCHTPIIEIETIKKWTIHNNTKVLRDLSDEQRGLLFNSWVKDKDCIEFYYGLMEDFESSKNITWVDDVIYRVRQKSERELFIEKWSSKIATAAYRNESISQLVGEMFDAKLESCNKEKTNAN